MSNFLPRELFQYKIINTSAMKTSGIFDRLWEQYSTENPSVKKIHRLFEAEGEEIINDHVAFRTFNDSRVGIDVIARPFLADGYREAGQYHFPAKKLFARHFEKEGFPRVFISELLLEEFSDGLQSKVRELISRLTPETLESPDLVMSGRIFGTLSHAQYESLRNESEYAAWVAVHGYRANHFTVSVNQLERFDSLEKVNDFLKKNGFALNDSGGEIKGTPGQLLEQSSTLADRIQVEFEEGKYEIPSCYYEFARRYKDRNGVLFSSFIAGSADKIFESTDKR